MTTAPIRGFAPLAVLVMSAMIATSPAQTVVGYSGVAGLVAEVPSASPLFPLVGPPQSVFPAAPPIGPPIPGMAPTGAVAVEPANGRVFYSNGAVIAAMANPAYLTPGIPPAVPIPPGPFPPFPAGTPALITGMALDGVAGILWVTNGVVLQGLVPVPGFPLIVPAFPIPPFVLLPVTGLEWDSLTGALWSVSLPGLVFAFTPAGVFVAGPILPPAGLVLPGAATGVTIDKSGLPAPGLNGRSIYVSAGALIFDYTTGIGQPSPAGPIDGLAFDAMPIEWLPPGCPCGALFNPSLVRLAPTTTGVPFTGIDWVGLPAFSPVFVAVDVVFNPAMPLINGVGCPFGMVLGSPTLVLLLGSANGAGVFSLPFGLVGVPPGVTLFAQYAAPCPADPAGIVLSSTIQAVVCAP